jgi:hypothetical protein
VTGRKREGIKHCPCEVHSRNETDKFFFGIVRRDGCLSHFKMEPGDTLSYQEADEHPDIAEALRKFNEGDGPSFVQFGQDGHEFWGFEKSGS